MSVQYPWGTTSIHTEPCGLRECVLRIYYVDLERAKQYAARAESSLLQRVARWRVDDPEGFRRLLTAMGVCMPRRRMVPWC
jgi:hypothetical protein